MKMKKKLDIKCNKTRLGVWPPLLWELTLPLNRPWQSQPTKKGKGVETKINLSIVVMFYGPKEAPNTI